MLYYSNLNNYNEWLTKERVLEYLIRGNDIAYKSEGDLFYLNTALIMQSLELGTGNGCYKLLSSVLLKLPPMAPNLQQMVSEAWM